MGWEIPGTKYVQKFMEQEALNILRKKNLIHGRKLIMENYINTQAQAVLKYQV